MPRLPKSPERRLRSLFLRATSTRIIAAYGLLFVIWSSAVISFIYWESSRYLRTVIDEIIAQRMSYIAGVAPGQLPQAMNLITAMGNLTQGGLFDEQGRHLAGSLPRIPDGVPIDGEIVELSNVATTAYGGAGPAVIPHVRAVAKRLPSGELVVLARDAKVVDRIGNIIGGALLWGLSLTIIPGLVGGFLLARGPRRRIEKISLSTEPIIRGDFSQRLPVSSRQDELDMLTSIVNRMLGEIERLVGEIKGVCDNIAHDLRTPLTRLRAQLHRLRQQTPDDDVRSATLERCIIDTDALLDRFRALLRISELEYLHRRAGFDSVDLSATLRQLHELYAPLAEDKGVRFSLDIAEPLEVRADAGLMFEAMSNLVSNAIKFTPAGGEVRLRANLAAAGVQVDVVDSGPGIPAEERDSVLQRFYRSENTRDVEGFGLGLSIVAAIVRLHGFQLEIAAARSDCGTRVSLRCWPESLVGTPAIER